MKRTGSLLGSALLLFALPPALAEAQRGRTQVEEGNRLYSQGLFQEAHRKYLEALLEDPQSPLIRFNDGSALYRSEDFQGALERFQEAAESGDPALVGSAWYNLGNALYRQQELTGSLEAYKEALRANPSDTDAKHNLERVLEKLQEQEDRNQQPGGDDQSEEEENSQQDPDAGSPQDQNPPRNPEEPQPPNEEGQEERSRDQQPPTGEEGQAESQRQPGQLTPEEAQRILEAIREDPGEVNRMLAPVTGKRPRKEW
jgi:tetratricopeptide (TPR) repeat protein